MKNFTGYTHFGNGDIFESREFIREYIQKINPENCFIAHGKPLNILADMPELQFTSVTAEMDPRVATKLFGDSLYLNLWIGRDSKYVRPNIGVVVEEYYRMHNDILRSLGLTKLSKDIYSYVPKIDYSFYEIGGIDSFVKEHAGKRIVLISNGPVHSSQAFNFDFEPVIDGLCNSFRDYIFITTQRTNLTQENLFFTGNIIKTVGTDLNEISYLSTFCDVCIGRNSGPHVFAQVLDNWLDPNKISISFTYGKGASHFVASDTAFPMKKEWSNATETFEVYRKICEVIG